jgi:hypothetical protein
MLWQLRFSSALWLGDADNRAHLGVTDLQQVEVFSMRNIDVVLAIY